jgi:hypothetical protein
MHPLGFGGVCSTRVGSEASLDPFTSPGNNRQLTIGPLLRLPGKRGEASDGWIAVRRWLPVRPMTRGDGEATNPVDVQPTLRAVEGEVLKVLWGSEALIKCLTCGFATPRPRVPAPLRGHGRGHQASVPLPWSGLPLRAWEPPGPT